MAMENEKEFMNVDDLMKFLEQNREVDILGINLQDEETINRLDFANVLEKKADIVSSAKAFQRLIRIIPAENQNVALSLLREGIHSALQIAAMTRKDFMGKCAKLLNDDGKLAAAIYGSALEKRSALLVQYMNMLQNREPHISSARFS